MCIKGSFRKKWVRHFVEQLEGSEVLLSMRRRNLSTGESRRWIELLPIMLVQLPVCPLQFLIHLFDLLQFRNLGLIHAAASLNFLHCTKITYSVQINLLFINCYSAISTFDSKKWHPRCRIGSMKREPWVLRFKSNGGKNTRWYLSIQPKGESNPYLCWWKVAGIRGINWGEHKGSGYGVYQKYTIILITTDEKMFVSKK